jgi:hypothetical protein
VPEGYEVITRRAVTIASDHSQGRVVIFDAGETLTSENIEQFIKPITTL